MPAAPLPDDLDPHISAFMIISERLSDIQESQAVSIANAKHMQMGRHGFLDNKLLGHPFAIERRPSDHQGLRVEQQANANHYPDSMIVTIEYQCAEYKRGLCEGGNADLSYFTPAESQIIQAADLTDHPSPKSLGIHSAVACLCEEALKRQVLSSFDQRAFDECYLLPSLDEGEFTIFLRAAGRQDVNAFVIEAVRLFSLRHNRSCISTVVVEDGDIFVMRVHEMADGCAQELLNDIPDSTVLERGTTAVKARLTDEKFTEGRTNGRAAQMGGRPQLQVQHLAILRAALESSAI
ncbi:hypothetical protein BDZ88DRAFT_456128 [Geranomyces variabilis]|nr:hypothetical protein BDZ88DRAFT_456128 [Geranomyces variabilis]KAJ3131315.1 hypothetical protein HDU90_008587 [Geranomyces variabilis]